MKTFFMYFLILFSFSLFAQTNYIPITDVFIENNNFLTIKQNLLFVSKDTSNGQEIWKTDGTYNGTNLALDISFGTPVSNIKLLFKLNDKIFFNAYDYTYGDMLWVSDMSRNGTQPLLNIKPDSNYIIINDTLYFTVFDYNYGHILWKSDGTSIGTKILDRVDIIAPLQSYDNKLFYITNNHNGTISLYNNEDNQSYLLSTINLSASNNFATNDMLLLDGVFYITILSNSNLKELIIYDINNALHNEIKSLSVISNFKALNNKVYFMAHKNNSQKGLWVSDGTKEGTKLIKIIPGSIIGNIISTRERLFFKSFDFTLGNELLTSDGTEDGTKVVKRFNTIGSLYYIDQKIYFTADDGIYGKELWSSDGSFEGTQLIEDHVTFNLDANIEILTISNNSIYLSIKKNQKTKIYLYMPETGTTIEEKVYMKIKDKKYAISGTFSSYDFNNVKQEFDWVFIDKNRESWQLHGDITDANNIFGWKKVDVLINKINWYMCKLDSDVDEDSSSRYDWLLVSSNLDSKSVYKLNGATSNGIFLYSQPIIINYSLSDDEKEISFNK